MSHTVAVFFWDPEGEPLPFLVVEPQEVSSEVYKKIDMEFALLSSHQDDIFSGTADDECYDNPKEAKNEYQNIHRGEPYYPLYFLRSKNEILEFLDTWEEFDHVDEDNLSSFFSDNPDLKEEMTLVDVKGLFTDKYCLYNFFSMGLSDIPAEVGKLL